MSLDIDGAVRARDAAGVEITPENAEACLDMLARGGEPAPIVHVDVQDFAPCEHINYAFSHTGKKAAEALRRLADHVEEGVVNLQKVSMLHEAPRDEFQQTTLTLVYNRMHHRSGA